MKKEELRARAKGLKTLGKIFQVLYIVLSCLPYWLCKVVGFFPLDTYPDNFLVFTFGGDI